ncbi:MAG: D-glucuronyl C5-epimerase family protein, partial [Brevundimonas sp.]|nr:D-glucuronyl C5-epimerase family protein [Brevundimonas sp.]
MRRTKAIVISTLISAVIITGVFNVWAFEITEFNAVVRTAITHGAKPTAFTAEGIPVQTNSHLSQKYTSPFYVVHYGLIYSEECRSRVPATGFHWLPDTTSSYWPQPPRSSLDLFKHSAEWVLDNISYDRHGNAHLMYNFDWPYKNYPNGKLEAPWSSGLTDAHTITLLLRAYDCFGESAYSQAADELYKSVTTPVQKGGSLAYVDGHPWIEEYIDPRVQAISMSHV